MYWQLAPFVAHPGCHLAEQSASRHPISEQSSNRRGRGAADLQPRVVAPW